MNDITLNRISAVKHRHNAAKLVNDMQAAFGATDRAAEKLGGYLAAVEQAERLIQATTAEIMQDNRLTFEGQQEKIKDATDAAKAELDRVFKSAMDTLESGEQFHNDLVKLALSKVETADPVLTHHRQAEIRARIAAMSEQEARKLYFDKLTNGVADEVTAALESDPMPMNFITDATRQQSSDNRRRVVSPDHHHAATLHRNAKQVLASLNSLI